MLLPGSPNRIWLLSFWAAMSLLIGLVTGAFAWALISLPWASLGALAALASAAAGLSKPRKLSTAYKTWNRTAGNVARFGQRWVTGACFYTVFLAVGRTGGSLGLARPPTGTESLWMPRRTLPTNAYVCCYKSSKKGAKRRGWITAYLSWAVGSRNIWACFLLPFLILLRAFGTEEKNSFPANIYTLY